MRFKIVSHDRGLLERRYTTIIELIHRFHFPLSGQTILGLGGSVGDVAALIQSQWGNNGDRNRNPEYLGFLQEQGLAVLNGDLRAVPAEFRGDRFHLIFSHNMLDSQAYPSVLKNLGTLTLPGGLGIHQTTEPLFLNELGPRAELRESGFDVWDVDESGKTLILRKRDDPAIMLRDLCHSLVEFYQRPAHRPPPTGKIIIPTVANAWDDYRDLVNVLTSILFHSPRIAWPALWHMLSNALIHGNGMLQNRNVVLGWTTGIDETTIFIEDEGTEHFGTSRTTVWDGGDRISGIRSGLIETKGMLRELGGKFELSAQESFGQLKGHRVTMTLPSHSHVK